MLFRDRITVYCENHMEHTNTLCGHIYSCLEQSEYCIQSVVTEGHRVIPPNHISETSFRDGGHRQICHYNSSVAWPYVDVIWQIRNKHVMTLLQKLNTTQNKCKFQQFYVLAYRWPHTETVLLTTCGNSVTCVHGCCVSPDTFKLVTHAHAHTQR